MKKLSTISVLHYFKLFFRSALFVAMLVLYILARLGGREINADSFREYPWILVTLGVIFISEMVLRFFPSRFESMGCQKQFKRNFIKTHTDKPDTGSARTTLTVALVWILLNGIIGVLFLTDIIDEGILILIALLYSVCDMICILFFCPFQTWFMKNKCCGSCRIYNWDYAMMFTPLVFIPGYFTYTVLGVALLLLLVWEVTFRIYPERFSEQTNECLSCKNCKEKLCHHKTQLRHFLKKNRESLILKGNTVIGRVKNKLNRKD